MAGGQAVLAGVTVRGGAAVEGATVGVSAAHRVVGGVAGPIRTGRGDRRGRGG